MINNSDLAHKLPMIFLVEDDEDDIILFQEAIENTHYELCIFKDCHALVQALAELFPLGPSIIFLDINMPKKNGFECLIQIQALFAPLPPVFFLSNYTSNRSVDIARKLGAAGYLAKQSSFLRFTALITGILLKDWTGLTKRDFYIQLNDQTPAF